MNKLATNLLAAASLTVLLAGNASALDVSKINVQPVKGTKLAAADTKPADPEKPATPAPKMVTVNEGDYLEKIATANQTTSLRIFYANTDIVNPDLVYPNEQVRIPEDSENLTPREVPVNKQIATPTPVEATSAAAPRVAANFAPGDGSVWDRLAACESGGNWAINTGNGFYGGLQFTLSTWQSLGGSGLPSNASREEQIARATALQARSGWGQWPACSAKLGLY